MSDSKVLTTMQIPPVQQQTQTLNFEIKKLNSAHEILETLKKQCVAFQSFSELQQACFQVFYSFLNFAWVRIHFIFIRIRTKLKQLIKH